MTREEAIETEFRSVRGWEPFANIPDDQIREAAAQTINCYVALGMLKLDEPKSAQDKFNEAFCAMDADARKYLCNITTLIDVCGLKIVEK